MGDSVRIDFTSAAYTAIPSLVADTTYWLQNVSDNQLMLIQQATQPAVSEIGKRINSCQDTEIIKETNDVWIKSVIGSGVAVYNAIPSAT